MNPGKAPISQIKGNFKVTITIIKQLDLLLKNYYPDKKERKTLIKDLVHQFEGKASLKYVLTNNITLILLKDQRKLTSLRRFKDSPFPFLTNIECFSSSLGDWNQDLLSYGIKSRLKFDDLTTSSFHPGVKIHLLKLDSINSRGNRYLHRQYARLSTYRKTNNISRYWETSLMLMRQS